VKLPAGSRVATQLSPFAAEDEARKVAVKDRVDRDALIFERTIDIPAGRVQPDAYATFQQFARAADSALGRDVIVSLPGGAR
jgi:hypothetical protein